MCGGDGFTEAVEVQFDPAVLSYESLLERFFEGHDYRRAEEKPQYQSAIWATSEQQLAAAAEALERRKGGTTAVVDMRQRSTGFTVAESVHQDFWSKVRLKLSVLALLIASTSVHAATKDFAPPAQCVACVVGPIPSAPVFR